MKLTTCFLGAAMLLVAALGVPKEGVAQEGGLFQAPLLVEGLEQSLEYVELVGCNQSYWTHETKKSGYRADRVALPVGDIETVRSIHYPYWPNDEYTHVKFKDGREQTFIFKGARKDVGKSLTACLSRSRN